MPKILVTLEIDTEETAALLQLTHRREELGDALVSCAVLGQKGWGDRMRLSAYAITVLNIRPSRISEAPSSMRSFRGVLTRVVEAAFR